MWLTGKTLICVESRFPPLGSKALHDQVWSLHTPQQCEAGPNQQHLDFGPQSQDFSGETSLSRGSWSKDTLETGTDVPQKKRSIFYQNLGFFNTALSGGFVGCCFFALEYI
jgi:hypothetical protein